jgi:hypothetical protein
MVFRVLVRFGHNPRWCVRDSLSGSAYKAMPKVAGRGEGKATYQIEYFSLNDKIVKRVHDLFNGSGPIPPVHIQDVDV